MKNHNRSVIAALSTVSILLMLSACSPEAESGSKTVGAKSSIIGSQSGRSRTDGARDTGSGEGVPGLVAQVVTDSSRPEVVVYKSANCGCCKEWVTYLEDEGFTVQAIDHDNVDQIKADNGLTSPALKSCHTALVDGYVIEGHVPVSDIERLLAERPDVTGLTAPGMPMMSPGMGSLVPRDYDVLAFRKDGSSSVFSSY